MKTPHCFAAIALCMSLALPAYADTTSKGVWETVANEDGFLTQRKSVSGSNLFAFRGETVADVSIARIIRVFLDPATRKNWVAMFGGTQRLEGPNALDTTYWIRFNTPFPTSDRDYVLRGVSRPDKSKRVFLTEIESVTHASKGEQDCCVRGEAFGTFYRFTALPGTKKTKVEVEVHTDPKGWIPGWLTNMIQKKWPRDTLKSLIREAKKSGVVEHPDYANWHDLDPKPEEAPAEASPAEASDGATK